jgi:hypothetical protein
LSTHSDSQLNSHYLLQKTQSVFDIRILLLTFLLNVNCTLDDKLIKKGRGFSEELKSPVIIKKDEGFFVKISPIHY